VQQIVVYSITLSAGPSSVRRNVHSFPGWREPNRSDQLMRQATVRKYYFVSNLHMGCCSNRRQSRLGRIWLPTAPFADGRLDAGHLIGHLTEIVRLNLVTNVFLRHPLQRLF